MSQTDIDTENTIGMSEGLITDEALEKWRERIGMKLKISNIFNQLASREAIRKYVDGIGDVNPLYRDEEHAKSSRYGGLVAPPNWVYSIFPTWVLQGLPGIHAFHSGNDWEFYKPIRENDFITPECEFTGFKEKSSSFAGRLVMEYQRSTFRNQKGELVAKTDLWLVRAERKAARQAGKYHKIELPHPWTDEQLKAVEEEVLAEEVRGATPRYWEDVEVGEPLAPVIKGPLGLTDIIAYCVGAAPVQIMAHHASLQLYHRHPAWAFRDPFSNALEPVYSVHYNKAAANAAGLPYPYDVGAQRQGWLINLLTNWMGDDGWLKKNYAEYRRFVYLSDCVWLKGKVTKKYIDDDGDYVVDVETEAINQRGENVMPGSGTICLPSKGGYHPLDRRL